MTLVLLKPDAGHVDRQEEMPTIALPQVYNLQKMLNYKQYIE